MVTVKNPTHCGPWTDEDNALLVEIINREMEAHGCVEFTIIEDTFPYRSSGAMLEKIYKMKIPFKKKYTVHTGPYECGKKAVDTFYPDTNPLLHKNGVMINYMKPPVMVRVVK